MQKDDISQELKDEIVDDANHIREKLFEFKEKYRDSEDFPELHAKLTTLHSTVKSFTDDELIELAYQIKLIDDEDIKESKASEHLRSTDAVQPDSNGDMAERCASSS